MGGGVGVGGGPGPNMDPDMFHDPYDQDFPGGPLVSRSPVSFSLAYRSSR